MKKNIRKRDIKKQHLAKSRKGGAQNAGMVNGKQARVSKQQHATLLPSVPTDIFGFPVVSTALPFRGKARKRDGYGAV